MRAPRHEALLRFVVGPLFLRHLGLDLAPGLVLELALCRGLGLGLLARLLISLELGILLGLGVFQILEDYFQGIRGAYRDDFARGKRDAGMGAALLGCRYQWVVPFCPFRSRSGTRSPSPPALRR